MTRWGCPVCSNRWAVRLLAGCPRCPGHPALVEEGSMPKTTVHSGSSNGPDGEPALTLSDYPEGGDTAVTAAAMQAVVTAADVRAWARENGIDVNPRGSIPGAVLEAYRQANPRAVT